LKSISATKSQLGVAILIPWPRCGGSGWGFEEGRREGESCPFRPFKSAWEAGREDRINNKESITKIQSRLLVWNRPVLIPLYIRARFILLPTAALFALSHSETDQLYSLPPISAKARLSNCYSTVWTETTNPP
jgi:hypothetical protein